MLMAETPARPEKNKKVEVVVERVSAGGDGIEKVSGDGREGTL